MLGSMTTLDTMLSKNRTYAAERAAAGKLGASLPATLPTVKSLIIGCADMRVDPEALLGTDPNTAVVIRNIGGRITPGTFEMLALLGRIGQVAEAIPGGGGPFDVIVLHHSDCGSKRLAGDPALLAAYFGVPENETAGKHVDDPRASVALDVAALRAAGALPAAWTVSGLVYDVDTGLVDVVVPPAPLGA